MLEILALFNLKKTLLILPLIGITSSLYIFSSKRKHLIVTLLSLEGSMLCLLYAICMMTHKMDSIFIFMVLTLSVCEAALGLSILVNLVRTHNNDFINSINLI